MVWIDSKMVTVKFYGLIREQTGKTQLIVSPGTVREIMVQAAALGVDKKYFREAVLFAGKQQLTGSGRYTFKLNDGDELSLLSPLGGG